MKLDVKRQLFARSERCKAVDFHPTEPWILTTLYSGSAYIWSYETQQVVKTFELTDVPVRAGRFIARKNLIVTGADDYQIRVSNYNTNEKVAQFEAHPDYIRAIAVHPTQPFILTASDDMTIKCWNIDTWKLVRVFEGSSHYVMSLDINPKDDNVFASACLDRTVKIWSLGSSTPSSQIDAHEAKGVNSVAYYPHQDRPYLVTASDDRTVKVWDYTTKSLIATLEGHTNNVSFAVYHPELPAIISGSEDGTIKIWNSNTYRLENSLNYGLERAWCVATLKGKQSVAVGFDDGSVVIKLGRDEPAVSMDSSGKLIYSKNSEVISAVIKPDPSVKDNETITINTKELGTAEVYPQTLTHSPNGRFAALCGDGEYTVYTALAWRNKSFGTALDFVWADKANSNDFAVLENATTVKVFKNFQEKAGPDVGFSAEGLTGGTLLGVKGAGGISFFDWASGGLVRRIEVEPKAVYWSENGDLVCLAGEDTAYILRYSRDQYLAAVQDGTVEDDGVEAAFEVVTDVNENVRSGLWLGDVLVFTNDSNRVKYLVGDQTQTISVTDKSVWILGYISRDARVYLCDKDINITSFGLTLAVLEYQTLVLRGDLETASELIPTIPQDQMSKIARFLEAQGYDELALEVATDPEHKFDLSIKLQRFDLALELAKEADAVAKFKSLGDTALAGWNVPLATECFERAQDLSSLLLVWSSTGNRDGLQKLAEVATEAGAHNVAMTSRWLLGDIPGCLDILINTGRLAEAVLFSQTYKPSMTSGIVKQWKSSLESAKHGRVAKLIAVPGEDDELFPEWDEWLKLEEQVSSPDVVMADGDVDGPEEEDTVGKEEEQPEDEAEEGEEGEADVDEDVE